MPRNRARCLRRRSRSVRSAGLASSMTSPAGSIFCRMSAVSCSNEAAVSPMARRIGTSFARRIAATVASTVDRKFASDTSCKGSSGAPSTVSAARASSRFAGACSSTSELSRNRTVSLVAASASRTAADSVMRLEPLQTSGSTRRQRKTADGLDNTVEFEGPEGACIHGACRVGVTTGVLPCNQGNRKV